MTADETRERRAHDGGAYLLQEGEEKDAQFVQHIRVADIEIVLERLDGEVGGNL